MKCVMLCDPHYLRESGQGPHLCTIIFLQKINTLTFKIFKTDLTFIRHICMVVARGWRLNWKGLRVGTEKPIVMLS